MTMSSTLSGPSRLPNVVNGKSRIFYLRDDGIYLSYFIFVKTISNGGNNLNEIRRGA